MITLLYKIALLLVFLPFFMRFFDKKKNIPQEALKIPFLQKITELKPKSYSKSVFKMSMIKLLVWAIWISLVIAVARPQSVGEKILIQQYNRVFMLVLDASGSMQETDFSINGIAVLRFFVMKKIVAEFIKKRKEDKIGIVLFGSNAYVYAPPSDDTKTLLYLLDTAEQGLAGNNTAMGDGLALAVKVVQDLPEEQRVAILLSDGVSNTGALQDEKALELAKSINMKVYTIAMGTSSAMDFLGIKVAQKTSVDDKILKKIATETGGKFYFAESTKELAEIYNEINKQEPMKNESKYYQPVKELFFFPLAIAFFLSCVLLMLIKEKKNVV